MFGSFISSVIKVVTLPVDIVEATVDVACGGDGSKESRKNGGNIMSSTRDVVCDAIKESLDD